MQSFLVFGVWKGRAGVAQIFSCNNGHGEWELLFPFFFLLHSGGGEGGKGEVGGQGVLNKSLPYFVKYGFIILVILFLTGYIGRHLTVGRECPLLFVVAPSVDETFQNIASFPI